jgi:hypothetical protein
VIRRRAGRLEEQALLGGDATVGPERQEHERHRCPVGVFVVVVLPERPAAPAILTELFHGGDDAVVLAVGVLLLIAGVVPLRPTVDERRIVARERAPLIPLGGGATEGKAAEMEREHAGDSGHDDESGAEHNPPLHRALTFGREQMIDTDLLIRIVGRRPSLP